MIRPAGKTILAVSIGLFAAPAAFGQADTGSADFTAFVALGDSLAAGEVSNNLVETYQVNSVPALLYRQVHGTDDGFEQPLIEEPGDLGRLVIGPNFLPVRLDGTGGPANADPSRPFTNMGASGSVRVNDVLTIDGLASCEASPLASTKDCVRMNLTLQDRGTQLAQVLEQDPTFVLVSVGINDALSAALLATVSEGVTLTPVASFEADYRAMVDALVAAGADLVLTTVADVTLIPFVTSVPPVVVDPATREPVIIAGQTVPLFDSSGDLAPADRVTLLGTIFLAAGCGIPDSIDQGFNAAFCPNGALPDEVVLKQAEAAQISLRIDEYNEVIRTVAAEAGAAVGDVAALVKRWYANGESIGGIDFSLEFLTGGLISFDGAHPAPLAYALMANVVIRAINRTYGARIPLVTVTRFMIGPEGNLAPPVPPTVSEMAAAQSFESVRAGLGLPTPEELRRLIGEQQDPGAGTRPARSRSRALTRDFR